MSASPTDMQQLLGGLLNAQQPNSLEGLLGQYGGSTNLGLSILAANKPSRVPLGFGNVMAQGALDSQQLAMQQAQQRLALTQGAMGLGMSMQKLQALAPFLGGGVTPQGQGNQQVPQQAAAAIPQGGQPQGSVQTQAQPQAVAAASQDNPLDQMPINGMPPALYRRLAILQGKDPLETEKELHALQLQAIQEKAKPQIDQLDNIIKSDKPSQYVAANPQLLQAWQQGAPALGIDPRAGFNDQNVRTVLNFSRNQLAARAQLGQEAPNVPLQTQSGPLGSMYQRDPISGKLTQVKGEESLKDVIDPQTGKPTNLRASIAEGKQPFNASIYGAQNVSDQALQFAADTYRTTGKFPAAFGRNPAMQAKVLDKIASDAKANGDTAGSIAARSASLKANGQALDAITKQQTLVGSYEQTARKNIDLAEHELGKLELSGSPMVNKALNAWRQGISGDPTTAGFINALTAARTEYAKVLSGATGSTGITDAGRNEASELFNKNMNPDALRQAFNVARQEMANRMSSFEDQRKELTTHLSQNTLTPETSAPKPSGAPAVGQIVKGYRFKGGNPADKASWEKSGG